MQKMRNKFYYVHVHIHINLFAELEDKSWTELNPLTKYYKIK